MKPPVRACEICGEPAVEGRVLCSACDREYDRSPEHARAACALSDFVDRIRAERQTRTAAAPAKFTPGEVKAWGSATPAAGGYRPPDPEGEGT